MRETTVNEPTSADRKRDHLSSEQPHLLASSEEGVTRLRSLLGGRALKRFLLAIRVVPDSCWSWQGDRYDNGYGRFSLDDVEWLAHRLAYACMVGPIPYALTIDHLCNNRLCVNPDHLAIATRADNTRRGDGSPRPTRCPQGHEYTSDNTRVNADGYRQCRACDRDRARKKRFTAPGKVKEINHRSYLKHKEKYLERRKKAHSGATNAS